MQPKDTIRKVYGPYRQKISKNSIKWRVELRGSSGRRIIRSFSSRVAAQEFADKIKGMISPGMQMDNIIEQFKQYLIDKGNESNSIDTAIKRLYSWFQGNEMIIEITPNKVSKIYDDRVKSCAVDTQRNELNQVKAFFKFAVKHKIIKKNPAECIEPVGKRSKGREQLRIDEAKLWIKTAQNMVEEGKTGVIAAMIALYLGPRANEIVTRRVRDIDDNCKLFWIPSSKTPSGRRIVEVPEELQPYLKMLVDGKRSWDFLFPSKFNSKSGHVTVPYVTAQIKAVCDRAGLPPVCAHSMRGLHATIAVEYGTSSHSVAATIGHDNFKVTTDHYIAKGTVENAQAKKVGQRLRLV